MGQDVATMHNEIKRKIDKINLQHLLKTRKEETQIGNTKKEKDGKKINIPV